jgi:NAD(P)-dependent dehydrogenase (short-subunit alcohol dehydrogenase family)
MPGTLAITGGASGLGLATARRFIEGGWKVAIIDWNQAAVDAAAELGDEGSVLRTCGDVSDAAAVDAFYAEIGERFGAVECVLNAAGNMPQMKPTLDQSIEDWQSVVDVHLRGTYLSCRGAGRLARDTGEKLSIVNVSSIVGEGAFPKRSEYGPAKAAITQLTRSLAIEWAESGWRVNCIAPGYVWTPSFEGLVAEGKLDPKPIEKRAPMGRIGDAEEFAELCEFLLTRATYVTGVTVPMDGGWLAYGYL